MYTFNTFFSIATNRPKILLNLVQPWFRVKQITRDLEWKQISNSQKESSQKRQEKKEFYFFRGAFFLRSTALMGIRTMYLAIIIGTNASRRKFRAGFCSLSLNSPVISHPKFQIGDFRFWKSWEIFGDIFQTLSLTVYKWLNLEKYLLRQSN